MSDDRQLFEKLSLEAFMAGLSWLTILRKRENFRTAFENFEIDKVAGFGTDDVDRLLADAGIVRHRGKVESAVTNARLVLEVAAEHGSFAAYLWSFVGGTPLDRRAADWRELPAQTEESRALSRDLKRRGFRFVGPTTCYSLMQAGGLVNDHETSCFRHRAVGGGAR